MNQSRAYVPGFNYDIFVSYAHVDDRTADEGEKGWVKRFHDHLTVKLGQRFGRADSVRIWRAPKLTGNELFDRVIEDRIDRSAVFLALTSQGYLASDYCRQEVRWFHDKAGSEEPGRRVGERTRFFNVLLNNVSPERWPAELGRTLGFRFHDRRSDFGRPLEPGGSDFQDRLWELVDALYQTLKALKALPEGAETSPAAAPGDRCDVYLAAVADSLRTPRARLAEELRRRGHEVGLKPPPPYSGKRHREAARRAITGARLSVHLLDDLRGAEIEGDEENTYPWEQVRLGRERAAAQLLWVPRTVDLAAIEDQRQKRFLAELEGGERGERPYDFLRGTAAELAAEVDEKLRQLAAAPAPAPPAVLLDIQRRDELCVLELSRALLDHQVLPFINPQENDPRRNDEILRSRLAQVGAVVIVHGRVDEEWVHGRLEQTVNIAVAERFPVKAFGIYLAPPDGEKADPRPRFPFLNLHLLDNRRGFDARTLEPLLADLAAGDGR